MFENSNDYFVPTSVNVGEDCVDVSFQDDLESLFHPLKRFTSPYDVYEFLNIELPKLSYLYAKGVVDTCDEVCDFYGGICEVVEGVRGLNVCFKDVGGFLEGEDVVEDEGDRFDKFPVGEIFTGYEVLKNMDVIEYTGVCRLTIRDELNDFLGMLDLFENNSEAIVYHFDLYWSMIVKRLELKFYELFKADVLEILESTPVVEYVDQYVFVNAEISEDTEVTESYEKKIFLKKLKKFTKRNVGSTEMCRMLENLGFESKPGKGDTFLYVNPDVSQYAVTFKLHGEFFMYSILGDVWNEIERFYSVCELKEAFVDAGFKIKF